MEPTQKKMTLSVPIAIIIAGLMVAGAVYFSNHGGSSQTTGTANSQKSAVQSSNISINPISDKDYIRGNPNSKVVMVEYSDTECPFCKQFHTTVKSLIDTFGKDGTLAWVYRSFPIAERHPKAPHEAEALLCAGKLGGQTAFWNYTDQIYAVTPSNNGLDETQLPIIAKNVGLDVTAFNTCLSSGEMTARVSAERDDAVKSGGNGTPYSVLVTNKDFDAKAVTEFIDQSVIKYGFPADLITVSSDNRKVGVSGAMPDEFMSDLITLLAK